MKFIKKIFSSSKEKTVDSKKTESQEDISLDEMFVKNFTNKSGKFLYCTHQEEVNQNLKNILKENSWETTFCLNNDLEKMLLIADSNSTGTQKNNIPFFTTCEYLIAKEGNILFTSNQLGGIKLKDLPVNFIVFAKTSQIVKDNGDSLIGINSKKWEEIPSNIGAIKCYDPNKKDDSFMSYGNNNSKNLYLLLLEDL